MSLPRTPPWRHILWAAALVLGSCGGSDSPTDLPTVAAVVILTPPDQQPVGSTVTVQVRVDDTSGSPVAGAAVSFSVTGGSTSPSTATTGASGTASVAWTLGTVPGSQTLTATVSGEVASTTVTTVAGAPATFEKLSGDGQEGAAGEPLAEALVVSVTDVFGNPLAGETVTAATEDGSVASASTTTGTDGRASFTWTLSDGLGANTLTATHALGSVTFTATATPGAPARVVAISGDNQTGSVGTPLADPLVAEIRDRLGHVVPGATVVFASVAGEGSVAPDTATADSDGRAQGVWTLGGEAGAQRVEVRTGNATPGTFQATAEAGPASALVLASGDGQEGPVGQPLGQPVVVEIRDSFGNPVSGTSVAFTTEVPGGSFSPARVQTGADGTAVTTWTLGSTVGEQSLTANAEGLTPVLVTAQALPGAPAEVRAVSGGDQTGTVGQPLSALLVARAVDLFGNPVPGATVTFTPGVGSTDPASAQTDGEGLATSTWTLGTTAGEQTLTATAVGASPASFTATAVPGSAETLEADSGDGQTGQAQSTLVAPLVVAARDAFGNGVPGVSVSFTVTGGGGSVSPASATTGDDGTAGTAFTLGSTVGEQQVQASANGLTPVSFTATATPAPAGAYDVEIRVIGTMSPAVLAAFTTAEARWEQVVTGDVPSVDLTGSQISQCGNAPAEDVTVDDLVIYAEVAAIDGVGGTLGQAGPCWIRSGSLLPVVGTMTFDEADLTNMLNNGVLGDVILHEMGHVIGIGSLWANQSLIQDAGTADPYFSGPLAVGAYVGLGGTLVNGVPVENTGGSGTQDVHWRETTFGNELMTGFVSGAGNPLSALTIQSLADQGYTVDTGAADAYTLPAPTPTGARIRTRDPWERILAPRGTVGPGGSPDT